MITAPFGGADRQFCIHTKSAGIFEMAMGRSLYAVLREFTDGRWTFESIARVLSFALYGPPKDTAMFFGFAARAAADGMPMPPSIPYRPHPDVVKVLQDEGHGNYANLAAEILEAAIFGKAQESADG